MADVGPNLQARREATEHGHLTDILSGHGAASEFQMTVHSCGRQGRKQTGQNPHRYTQMAAISNDRRAPYSCVTGDKGKKRLKIKRPKKGNGSYRRALPCHDCLRDYQASKKQLKKKRARERKEERRRRRYMNKLQSPWTFHFVRRAPFPSWGPTHLASLTFLPFLVRMCFHFGSIRFVCDSIADKTKPQRGEWRATEGFMFHLRCRSAPKKYVCGHVRTGTSAQVASQRTRSCHVTEHYSKG